MRNDDATVAEEIAAWVAETFAKDRQQREAAIDMLRRAIGHWRERGWLNHDLAAHLDRS